MTRRRTQAGADDVPAQCAVCTRPFRPHPKGTNRTYCSDECADHAQKERQRAAYTAVFPAKPVDEAAVDRCRDAMRDGINRAELKKRFGGRTFNLAMAKLRA